MVEKQRPRPFVKGGVFNLTGENFALADPQTTAGMDRSRRAALDTTIVKTWLTRKDRSQVVKRGPMLATRGRG